MYDFSGHENGLHEEFFRFALYSNLLPFLKLPQESVMRGKLYTDAFESAVYVCFHIGLPAYVLGYPFASATTSFSL